MQEAKSTHENDCWKGHGMNLRDLIKDSFRRFGKWGGRLLESSRPAEDAHWITLKPHGDDGPYCHVQITSSGKIAKGPKEFTGKHISELSAEHKRADHLKGDAHSFLSQQHTSWEKAKENARKVTGMHAGRIAQHENAHRDHSVIPGFDTSSRTAARENPELGVDPDAHDAPAQIWNIIRQGKKQKPSIHSKEVANLAAEWAKGRKQQFEPVGTFAHDDDWNL